MKEYAAMLMCLAMAGSPAVLSAATFEVQSNAKDQQNLVSIKTEGLGITPEKALQNAIYNAIQQVVGQYVQAETIVSNDTIIKDQIIGYSAGYMESYRILKQAVDPDGLHHVEILGAVKQTRLLEKLQALNIAVKIVDGGVLAAKAETMQQRKEQAAELLSAVWSQYPQAAFDINISSVDIDPSSSSGNMSKVVVKANIKWDEKFISHLQEVLDQIAFDKKKMMTFDRFEDFDRRFEETSEKPSTIICFSRKSNFKTPAPHKENLTTIDACQSISTDDFMLAMQNVGMMKKDTYYLSNDSSVGYIFSGRNNGVEGESILVELLDSQKIPLLSRVVVLSDGPNSGSLSLTSKPISFIHKNAILYKNIESRHSKNWKMLFLTDEGIDFSFSIDVPSNELSNMKSVQISVMDFR